MHCLYWFDKHLLSWFLSVKKHGEHNLTVQDLFLYIHLQYKWWYWSLKRCADWSMQENGHQKKYIYGNMDFIARCTCDMSWTVTWNILPNRICSADDKALLHIMTRSISTPKRRRKKKHCSDPYLAISQISTVYNT